VKAGQSHQHSIIFIERFSALEDPRDPSKCRHKLIEVSIITPATTREDCGSHRLPRKLTLKGSSIPTQGVALGWYVMPLRGFRPTGSQSGGRSYDQGPDKAMLVEND
jgi:hypothetical protein